MNDNSLDALVAKTVEINSRFKTEFDDHGRVLSLVSEVGELADAVLEYDGVKEKGIRSPKGKSEIGDALADLLYNLILVAYHYDVNLSKEYERILKNVEERLKTGEFVEAKGKL